MTEEKTPDSTTTPEGEKPLRVEIVASKPIPVELKGNLGKELLATGLSAALGRAITRLVDAWIDDAQKGVKPVVTAITIPQTPDSTTTQEVAPDNRPVVIIQQTVSSKIWVVLLVVGGIVLGISQVKSCSEIDQLKAKVVQLENKDCGNGQ